jgi:hypothetical protein
MRRTLSLAAALLMAGGLSAPAFAQAAPQVTITSEMTNQDLNMSELQAFDQIATGNPSLARRLAANPRLVNSESFLKKNPELNDFFEKFPGSKERFLADPGNYLANARMHHGRMMRAKKTAAAKSETKPEEAKPTEAAPEAPNPSAPSEPPAAPSNP